MNWIVFAASLAAVLVLAGIAWALRLGGAAGSIATPEEALGAAEDALSGFTAVAAAIGTDRRAALVLGEGGRVAVLKAHGARVAAREVDWGRIRATGAGLMVDSGERLFGRVLIEGVDALDIRRLTPEGTGWRLD